jgi:hypothetical protein
MMSCAHSNIQNFSLSDRILVHMASMTFLIGVLILSNFESFRDDGTFRTDLHSDAFEICRECWNCAQHCSEGWGLDQGERAGGSGAPQEPFDQSLGNGVLSSDRVAHREC